MQVYDPRGQEYHPPTLPTYDSPRAGRIALHVKLFPSAMVKVKPPEDIKI